MNHDTFPQSAPNTEPTPAQTPNPAPAPQPAQPFRAEWNGGERTTPDPVMDPANTAVPNPPPVMNQPAQPTTPPQGQPRPAYTPPPARPNIVLGAPTPQNTYTPPQQNTYVPQQPARPAYQAPNPPAFGGVPFQAQNPAMQSAVSQETPKYASRTSVVLVAVFAFILAIGLGITGLIAGIAIGAGDTSPIISGDGNININHFDSDYTVEANTEGTIANVVTKVSPAVVEIYTDTVSYSQYYGQQIQSGAGSGVILTNDGYIITCAHVIDGADKITVRLKDGSEMEAKVVGSDSQTDIAVVKIETKEELPYVGFGSSENLVVGQPVVAVGNPLGSLGGTVTTGIISAKDREIEIEGQLYNLLQTNAAINSGNSGGGLFDMNGNLIGIVNAKSGGESIEGLGFAIPSQTAEDIASQLMAYGYVKGRPVIGIQVLNVNSQEVIMQYLQYSRFFTQYGLYIIESEHESLQTGDRIVAINGDEITDMSDLQKILQNSEVGDVLQITVARIDGNRTKLVEVEITLRERTAEE